MSRLLRCAIYTRKSSEEGLDQDFNSLDAQREACAAYIQSQRHEGWKRYRVYQVAGDRQDLIVMEQFATLEQARAYASSQFLRDAFEQEGVVGQAEVLLLDGLEEGSA